MRKIRTPITLVGILVVLPIGCAEVPGNCEPVQGRYYPVFTFLDVTQGDGEPADCTRIPIESLDLSGDKTINNSTSVEIIDIWSSGCAFTIDYARSVTLPNDHTGEVLHNNGSSRYQVQPGATLTGQVVYHRFDREGRESCYALFDATWMSEATFMEMMGTAL